MANSKLRLKGQFKIKLTGPDGRTKYEKTVDNLIVDDGHELAAARLIGTAIDALSHIAIGTSSTAAAAGQSVLQGTELARESASVSYAANVATVEASFPAGTGTGTVEEAGIFNAASAGTMFSRILTGTFTKSADDALTITYTATSE